jgi:hypothetical protein
VPNLGPTELIILAIFVLAIVFLLRKIAARNTSHARLEPPQQPQLTEHLQLRARELIGQGKIIAAIKLIREETGLSLKEAKLAADNLAAGRTLPVPGGYGSPVRANLAERVRELKSAGRGEQALLLVRGETGMSHGEAAAFVAAVEAETDTPG